MTLETQIVDITEVDVKNKISRLILICGYSKGCNQFIEAIRQESDIPIWIISDTLVVAEIKRISWIFPNIYTFKEVHYLLSI